MIILGIETSCDETAASVVEFSACPPEFPLSKEKRSEGRDGCRKSSGKGCLPEKISVLSGLVSSQIDIHKKYGGVVPEVAARAHMENILPVIREALDKAAIEPEELDAIAVTTGPGLVTSLIVGVETAKSLAYAWEKLLIPVNHMEGHIAANWLGIVEKIPDGKVEEEKVLPALCLIVSGGHTETVLMEKYGKYEKIGQTRDDAAGEAFDKVAKLLGLGYPGGPIVSKLAESGNPETYPLPRPMMHDNGYDFSFSGLKTAVLYLVRDLEKNGSLSEKQITDICAGFQQAAVDVLTHKTVKAAKDRQAKAVMLSGGVAANSLLRETLAARCEKEGLKFYVPPIRLCTDNATMIALAGYFHAKKENFAELDKIKADPNLEL